MEIKLAVHKQEFQNIDVLAREIWQEHYTPIIGASQVEYMLEKFQSVDAMNEQINAGYKYFCINLEDKLIGYFAIQIRKENLFLSKFYLELSQRGKGYGRSALSYIEQWAKERGLNAIELTVNKHNTNSIASYQNMGFDISKDVVMDIGNGYVMDDHVMVKTLR